MPFVFAQACVPAVPVWARRIDIFLYIVFTLLPATTRIIQQKWGALKGLNRCFFTKPSDGFVVCKEGKSVEIPYPRETNSFCLEVELVVAIGKTAPETGFITPEEAEEYIFGYAAGVEFTRREFSKQSLERTANLG